MRFEISTKWCAKHFFFLAQNDVTNPQILARRIDERTGFSLGSTSLLLICLLVNRRQNGIHNISSTVSRNSH